MIVLLVIRHNFEFEKSFNLNFRKQNKKSSSCYFQHQIQHHNLFSFHSNLNNILRIKVCTWTLKGIVPKSLKLNDNMFRMTILI
jgi:hypothetical protein